MRLNIKNILIIIGLILLIIIIFIFFSCDVLTKMNEQEWNEKNLDEEEKKEINIYFTGDANYDCYTVKLNILKQDSNQRLYDSGFEDYSWAIIAMNNNIYIAGKEENAGVSDFLITKYDSDLKSIKNITPDAGVGDCFYSIASDPSNNIYAAGTDGNDICTTKYDADLNQLITYQFFDVNGGNDCAYGIAYNNGSLYVVGYGTQPPGEQAGDTDMTIIKYNSSSLVPTDIIYYPIDPSGETYFHQAKDIAIDNYGNIYVIGYVQIISGVEYNCIFLKYDSDLNLIWSKTIDINNDDRGEGVAVDSLGNIYLALHSGTGAGNFDCYTIKYNPYGDEIWRKHYGSAGVNEQLWDIAVDPLGNIYSVGNSEQNYMIIIYNYNGEEKNVLFFNNGTNGKVNSVTVKSKNL